MIAALALKILMETEAITTQVGQRIHIAQRPQKYDLDALVIEAGPETRLHHFQGPVPGTRRGDLSITALAQRYIRAKDLADLVTAALDGRTGTVEHPLDNWTLDYMMHEAERDIPSDHRDGAGQIQTHGRQVTFAYMMHPTPDP